MAHVASVAPLLPSLPPLLLLPIFYSSSL